MKKVNALLLAVVLVLSTLMTASCGLFNQHSLCEECGKCTVEDCDKAEHEKCKCSSSSNQGGAIPTALPVYGDIEGHEGFYLSIFGDPAQQTVEAYQQLVDLGCNWVYLDPWSGTGLNSSGLIKALEACEAVGLNALIMVNNTHNESDDDLQSFLELATIDYTQYPAFKGLYAFDEPSVAQMYWIENQLEQWEASSYKDYIFLVNLMRSSNDAPTTEEYLSKYWDIVLSKNDDNILIYDTYPLYAKIGDKVEPYIRIEMLDTLEQFAKLAKEKGSKFYTYVQTYCEKNGTARDMVSVNDARFQIAMNLAYGVDGFVCFTYLSMTQFGPSMVTGAGEKLPKYYYMQEVFAELENFEDVYFSFDWQDTMTILGPNRGTDRGYGEQPETHITSLTESLDSHDRIDNIETEYDLIIGTFKDKDGYDGFLITSYTDPYYMKDNNVSITFSDASRALVYYNGSLLTNDADGACYLLNNGMLNFDLEAGDYLFVVPVK